MIKVLLYILLVITIKANAQVAKSKPPLFNVRLSFLVFPPFSPLITLETSAIRNVTLQLETNFANIHGANLKYFINANRTAHYIFIGNAFILSKRLRIDKKYTLLPYLGFGYAHHFGKTKRWVFDSRFGIGPTLNEDKNLVLPVLKTGIGRTF